MNFTPPNFTLSPLGSTIDQNGGNSSTTFAISLTMLLLCIIGGYGNLISVLVFSHRTMKAPINILLRALSLIDTALILSSIVVFILPNLNLTFQNNTLRRACEFGSLYLYPISMTMQTCSVYLFVLVSLERYLAVCSPLQRHKLMTVRQARMAQIILFALALSYNFVRFWEYERTTTSNETTSSSDYDLQAPIQPLLRFQKWYFLFYYVILYILINFLIPFGVISILNAYIVRALKRNSSSVSGAERPEDNGGGVKRESTVSAHRNSSVFKSPHHQQHHTNPKDFLIGCRLRRFSRRQMRQRQTTHMMGMITLIFAVCNAPAFLLNVWEGVDEELFYGPWAYCAYIALDISNNLVVFNSSSTFIFYLIYCSKYRALFVRYGLCNLFGYGKRGLIKGFGSISDAGRRESTVSRIGSKKSFDHERITEYCSLATVEEGEITVI